MSQTTPLLLYVYQITILLVVTLAEYEDQDKITKIREIRPDKIIEGGKIDVTGNAALGLYGNDVEIRRQHLEPLGQRTWIDVTNTLTSGSMTHYYVYIHHSDVYQTSRMRLQVWRPTANQYHHTLVWERAVTVNMSYVMGAMYIFALSSEDSVYTQDGDMLGWTNIDPVCPISLDTLSSVSSIYRDSVNNQVPSLHSTYEFVSLGFPYAFSVAAGYDVNNSLSILGIAPLHGPIAGGTKVTITGVLFSAPEKVVLGDTEQIECLIIERGSGNYFVIQTIAVDQTLQDNPLRIIITFSGNTDVRSEYHFVYMANPIIKDIYPLKTIPNGGTTLTVSGTSMDSVARPVLEATLVNAQSGPARVNMSASDTYYEEMCSMNGSNAILCPTPMLTDRAREALGPPVDSSLLQAALYIGFRLDGYDAYRNVSANKELSGRGVVSLYLSPEFTDINQVFDFEKDVLLDIKGSHLNAGVDISDYGVTVGSGQCDVIAVTDNSISCLPPQTEPEKSTTNNGKYHDIHVTIGLNSEHSVGEVRYKDNLVVIIAAPVCSVLIAIVLVIIVVFVYKKRASSDKNAKEKLPFNIEKRYGTDPEYFENVIDLPPIRPDNMDNEQ